MDYRSSNKNEVREGLARELKLASFLSRAKILASNETATPSVKMLNNSILKKRGNANLGAGFTLIEVLVVLGMMAVFASIGLVFSFDSYRSYLFRSEYTTTVNLLATARNRAMNNFNESNHGVSFLDIEYRVYNTDSYNPTDSATYETYPRNRNLTYQGPPEIIFEQLSGNLVSCAEIDPCIYSFNYGQKTKSITINAVGGIIW